MSRGRVGKASKLLTVDPRIRHHLGPLEALELGDLCLYVRVGKQGLLDLYDLLSIAVSMDGRPSLTLLSTMLWVRLTMASWRLCCDEERLAARGRR